MRPNCIQFLFPHGTGAVEGLGTNIGKKKISFHPSTNDQKGQKENIIKGKISRSKEMKS